MISNDVYQYISLNQDVNKNFKLLVKAIRANIFSLFDMEDSIEIPFDTERTIALKKRARKNLLELVELIEQQQQSGRSIGIRINHVGSVHFNDDIDLLRSIGNRIEWSAIILPKVGSVKMLDQYWNALEKIPFKELIILAETVDFFHNATAILNRCQQLNIQKIQYGHWDYFQSAEEFPIPFPNEQKFWDVIVSLLSLLKEGNFQYIHTPYCFLLDNRSLYSCLNYINTISNKPVGYSSLTFSQGLRIKNFRPDHNVLKVEEKNYSKVEKISMAKDIIEFFNQQQQQEFSFNISKKNHRFIAPHEYISAKKFLSQFSEEAPVNDSI